MTGSTDAAPAKLRIDKWLWAARFYRTRSLASAAVEAGQVRVDDERVKPARLVGAGSRLTIRRDGLAWELEVLAVAERRGSATLAAALYQESAQSAAARADEIARRRAEHATTPRLDGRPTKRDRRRLQDFLDEP